MTLFARPLRALCATLAVAAAALSASRLGAQQDLSQVQIQTLVVADGVYMLQGAGGNIGISVGKDGVFVIDDQFAPLTERIITAVRAVTSEPIRFVINTHWHGDHTGGNENMGKAGALLVAHHNVRSRLEVEEVLEGVTASGALPVVTFGDDMTFHLNGDELHVFHVEHAHTDGDAMIHFRRADVVQAHGRYLLQPRFGHVSVHRHWFGGEYRWVGGRRGSGAGADGPGHPSHPRARSDGRPRGCAGLRRHAEDGSIACGGGETPGSHARPGPGHASHS